jgi:dolichol-phosphate mannosyltransferase
MAALSIFYAIFLAVGTLFYGRLVEGWTTIIVLILMLGGLQLCVVGILGEYLWRVCDEVRRRPLFLVQDVVGSFPRHEHSLQGAHHNEVALRLLTDSGA